MHLTPAGLPSGIPGIGDDIDAAIQQAPHPVLHSIVNADLFNRKVRQEKQSAQITPDILLTLRSLRKAFVAFAVKKSTLAEKIP
jgi:hypothetical protein